MQDGAQRGGEGGRGGLQKKVKLLIFIKLSLKWQPIKISHTNLAYIRKKVIWIYHFQKKYIFFLFASPVFDYLEGRWRRGGRGSRRNRGQSTPPRKRPPLEILKRKVIFKFWFCNFLKGLRVPPPHTRPPKLMHKRKISWFL